MNELDTHLSAFTHLRNNVKWKKQVAKSYIYTIWCRLYKIKNIVSILLKTYTKHTWENYITLRMVVISREGGREKRAFIISIFYLPFGSEASKAVINVCYIQNISLGKEKI